MGEVFPGERRAGTRKSGRDGVELRFFVGDCVREGRNERRRGHKEDVRITEKMRQDSNFKKELQKSHLL